jgi:hypothetical protein
MVLLFGNALLLKPLAWVLLASKTLLTKKQDFLTFGFYLEVKSFF